MDYLLLVVILAAVHFDLLLAEFLGIVVERNLRIIEVVIVRFLPQQNIIIFHNITIKPT